jgi:hypothetical protein
MIYFKIVINFKHETYVQEPRIFLFGFKDKDGENSRLKNIFPRSLREVNPKSYSTRCIYINNMKYTDRITRGVYRVNVYIYKYCAKTRCHNPARLLFSNF